MKKILIIVLGVLINSMLFGQVNIEVNQISDQVVYIKANPEIPGASNTVYTAVFRLRHQETGATWTNHVDHTLDEVMYTPYSGTYRLIVYIQYNTYNTVTNTVTTYMVQHSTIYFSVTSLRRSRYSHF